MKEQVYKSIFKSWVNFTTYFGKSPHEDSPPPCKMKKMPTPIKSASNKGEITNLSIVDSWYTDQ